MFTIFKSHPSLTAALLATVATLALASSPADAMGFGRGGGHGGGFSRPAMGGGISRPAMTRMPMGGGQMRPMNTTRAAPRVASRPAGVGDGIRRGRSAGELGKASGRTIEARHARPAPARSNVADRSERHAAKHTAARHELDQARRAEFERHHEHRRREHHDFVPVSTFVTLDPVIPTDTVIIPPTTDTFVVPPTTERPSFVTVIGDDPKDSKTQEKAKAPACKWAIADVTITSWDKEMTVEKQQTWWKKFKEEALERAKKFVKDNAGKQWGAWIKAVELNISIFKAKTVILTYACIDGNGDVVDTKTIQLNGDEEQYFWVKDAKSEQTKVILKNLNKIKAEAAADASKKK